MKNNDTWKHQAMEQKEWKAKEEEIDKVEKQHSFWEA